MTRRQIATLALAAVTTLAAAAAEPTDRRFTQLPFGCTVTRSEPITGDQKDRLAQKLGTPLWKLSNTYLVVQGETVQINILETKAEEDARKLYSTIAGMRRNPAFCRLEGTRVIEFCKATPATALKAAYELGFAAKPNRVRYHISARVATVQTADYMALNELSNALAAAGPGDPGEAASGRIAELSKGFSFGASLALRVPRGVDAADAYRFTPAPVGTETQANDTAIYTFGQPPRTLGIPAVALEFSTASDNTGLTPTDRAAEPGLLAATPYWPVDDPALIALAKEITAGKPTAAAKVQALLEWLAPGRNIRASGPAGSRWGVKTVLARKQGHCWDSADCFVTLARAAGIPTRQVGGWLFGTSGHVWAEVLVEGKGWQQVDPTGAGRLACGIYHIPYVTTETGEMPILYVTLPRIEIIETR
jgi:hypothetical protein